MLMWSQEDWLLEGNQRPGMDLTQGPCVTSSSLIDKDAVAACAFAEWAICMYRVRVQLRD
jgi:hypothetical protein